MIIAECVDDHISPVDLAKKYSVNADTIRAWIRKAGKTLPKTYKKSIYPTDLQNRGDHRSSVSKSIIVKNF